MGHLLRWFYYITDIAERRCCNCGKLLGWRRHIRPRGGVSHGLCSHCIGVLYT